MRHFFSIVLVVCFLGVGLQSCKQSNEAIAKEWQILSISSPQMEAYKDSMILMYRELAKTDTTIDVDSLIMLSEAEEKANYESSSLNLKKDGNYDLTAGQEVQSGRWKMDGKDLVFVVNQGNQEISTKFIVKKLTADDMELLEVSEGDTLSMKCTLKK